MNVQFKSSFKNLCTSEARNIDLVDDFFRKLEMPSLDESDNRLDRNITSTEIYSAIKNMKSAKEPCPDVYPKE